MPCLLNCTMEYGSEVADSSVLHFVHLLNAAICPTGIGIPAFTHVNPSSHLRSARNSRHLSSLLNSSSSCASDISLLKEVS